MVLRLLFCPIRPFFCRIGLLTLHLWHLTDRMFLARSGKQGRREENSEDALANEGSHSALAQLSVPGDACKAKEQWRGVTAGRAESFDHDHDDEQEQV
jgi:hypothetical protein